MLLLESVTFELQMAKKAAKKKKKKSSAASAAGGGLKGFGSSPGAVAASSSSSGSATAEIDRSRASLAFYDYIERNGAGDNLKRVALAQFPIGEEGDTGTTTKIRGVMAQRPIQKGEAIIDIPYELALNLGRESSDPTLPAVNVLQEYCRWISGNGDGDPDDNESAARRKRNDGPYFEMLPPYMGEDCLGSTDFFSDEALDALQYPPIKDETLRRRQTTMARYERDVEPMAQISSNMYRWDDGTTPIEASHLQWAVWLITSRVLTVQGEEGTGEAYRLMIPLIDMCNHDRDSPHVLTGRAVKGGRLRILAGRNVAAGEQINICYGGGVAGNDRFIQDYGFLDTFDDGTAFDLVANALEGKAEFGSRSSSLSMSNSDKAATLEALGSTSITEDEAELANAKERDVRAAIEFRIGVKKALERLAR